MKSKSILNNENFDNSFSKNRRLKSFLFLTSCIFIGVYPHFFSKKLPVFTIYTTSLVVLIYGIWVLSKNMKVSNTSVYDSQEISKNFPTLDILVAARDEQNVIARLVERLFNLDYPCEKLKIYIIDDGSVDDTPSILKKLSQKYEKLNIISRSKNAGGGKSGALNHALKFISGDWVFILDADAQLKNDTLTRVINFAQKGSWSAVQLRKSVLNTGKNFLTACQGIEMAMDAYFQVGRLYSAGISELRGNGQLVRKDILLSCGSFNESTVTDDLDLSVRLILSQSKIGIFWDPPVMEEGVEDIYSLFRQRQRWAEGGLQRFFDYGRNLIYSKLTFIQKFDLTYFFILQYALPIISLVDLIISILFFKSPVYWPISLTAFTLSASASWFGCHKKHEGPVLPNNLIKIILYLIYLSHWFIVIPLVTLKMSIFPKKIIWKKTTHLG
tara:strand:+ start:71 stop:1396 length:1326 start_codon:yes stop_codon:yes gene_type:complete